MDWIAGLAQPLWLFAGMTDFWGYLRFPQEIL